MINRRNRNFCMNVSAMYRNECKKKIVKSNARRKSDQQLIVFTEQTITWFVAIANAKNGENENKSEEEFQSQSLQWSEFGGQIGVTESVVIRIGYECLERRSSGGCTKTLQYNVEQSAYKTNFASYQH